MDDLGLRNERPTRLGQRMYVHVYTQDCEANVLEEKKDPIMVKWVAVGRNHGVALTQRARCGVGQHRGALAGRKVWERISQ